MRPRSDWFRAASPADCLGLLVVELRSYENRQGHHPGALPVRQLSTSCVDPKVPLMSAFGAMRKLLLGISPSEATFARRGFEACDAHARQQLELAGATF